MRPLVLALFLSVAPIVEAMAQDTAAVAEILHFRQELNAEFADSAKSPLTDADRRQFNGLSFYPVDPSFRVTARFVRTPGQPPFEMQTTTSRRPVYEKYGEAHFRLGGSDCILNLYQSHRLRDIEEYDDQLFLPFTDKTNGFGSYGGGRYIDVTIPSGDTVVIDFNQAYNPYCCYNHKYSCPIPPKENHLPFPVTAGVKAFNKE